MKRTLLALSCAAGLGLSILPLRAAKATPELLPGQTEAPGWTQTEKPESFTKDNLWDLMDGGAEVFNEYGVVGAVTCRYSREREGARENIQVELYAMKDAGAAHGIFSLNSRGEAQALALGDEAVAKGYYILLRKGAYFASITSLVENKSALPACEALARSLAAKLPSEGELPALVKRFSGLAARETPLVYLRGAIALSNLYPFAAKDPFAAQEGVAAQQGKNLVIILAYPDEAQAAKQLGEAWFALSAQPKFKPSPVLDGGRCLDDDKGNRIILRQRGQLLLIGVGPEQAELDRLLSAAARQG